MRARTLLTLGLMLTLAPVGALRFPSHIASHMVVQRGAPFELQGTDAPHALLTAQLHGASYTATSDAAGRFSVTLPAQNATVVPAAIGIASSSGASAQLVDVAVAR